MSTTISAIDNLKEALENASEGEDLTSAWSSLTAWEERLKSFDSHEFGMTQSEANMLKDALNLQLIPLLKDFKKLQLPNDFIIKGVDLVKEKLGLVDNLYASEIKCFQPLFRSDVQKVKVFTCVHYTKAPDDQDGQRERLYI